MFGALCLQNTVLFAVLAMRQTECFIEQRIVVIPGEIELLSQTDLQQLMSMSISLTQLELRATAANIYDSLCIKLKDSHKSEKKKFSRKQHQNESIRFKDIAPYFGFLS